MSDAEGLARGDDWAPGDDRCRRRRRASAGDGRSRRSSASSTARPAAQRLDAPEIVRLFAARDADYAHVAAAADALRQAVSGEVIRYVVNRNINYTNICTYRCTLLRLLQGPHA